MDKVEQGEVLDLQAVRAKLGAAGGKGYWRSLEELADSPAFRELLHREFPRQASEWPEGASRREFLQLMGASLALAGLSSCTKQPTEQIAPYVRQPEELVLGVPLHFATALSLGGFGAGVVVESNEGRPTKVEGNPDHPASLGATDLFSQAAVLTLYDPDRSQGVSHLGAASSYEDLLAALRQAIGRQKGQQGAGLRLLTETVTSPTLGRQIDDLLADLPAARWHQYEPINRDAVREGSLLAFGEYVNTVYHFDRAAMILALDADFLSCGPGCLRYVRDFADGRRLGAGKTTMNRLYVAESTPSSTGLVADHRLRLRPSEIEGLACAVAARLGVRLSAGTGAAVKNIEDRHGAWLSAVVADLLAHRGASLVIPGDPQAPAVHALCHAINDALGNPGHTLSFTDPVEVAPVEQMGSLRALCADIDRGQVDLLLILGGNPAYTAPADLAFGSRLLKVGLSVHLGLYEDETSRLCRWHVPQAHELESFGDVRAYDGTVTIQQPLIAPLYGGRSAHELLAALSDEPERTPYEIVRECWRERGLGPAFEPAFRRALHAGLVAGSALPERTVALRWGSGEAIPLAPPPGTGLEIVFRPDPTIYDGRFANNGWLQELPKPVTRLAWDNVAVLSPATAQRLGLGYEIGYRGGEIQTDQVDVQLGGRTVRAPIWIVPGHADECLTVYLGYGRSHAGRVGSDLGYNAYVLRTSSAPWLAAGAALRKIGPRYPLADMQLHHSMEGRAIVRSATLGEYQKDPHFAHAEHKPPGPALTLYSGFAYKDHAWGMNIDLNACVGCGACVVACQAENNIPVVGKLQSIKHRAMHWLRVDLYYQGDADDPAGLFQPVPCMHCENAPCELVCPVGATVHDSEGLNQMVYNRCVGTRYCSNNCPYKVRRFNFLLYQDWTTPSLKLMRNPEVTVRSRGVMEKCTYCVQRIHRARAQAELEGRQVRDGEIVTACAAACPAQAIVFGDRNDPQSRLSRLKAEPRDYALLEDLNTRPRTTYLAAVKNPNPALAPGRPAGG